MYILNYFKQSYILMLLLVTLKNGAARFKNTILLLSQAKFTSFFDIQSVLLRIIPLYLLLLLVADSFTTVFLYIPKFHSLVADHRL